MSVCSEWRNEHLLLGVQWSCRLFTFPFQILGTKNYAEHHIKPAHFPQDAGRWCHAGRMLVSFMIFCSHELRFWCCSLTLLNFQTIFTVAPSSKLAFCTGPGNKIFPGLIWLMLIFFVLVGWVPIDPFFERSQKNIFSKTIFEKEGTKGRNFQSLLNFSCSNLSLLN